MKGMSETYSMKWWEGGTLHDKTLADWVVATGEDQFATCADMVMTLKQDFPNTITYTSGEEFIRYIVELMTCISVITDDPNTHALSVADVALNSARHLGYIQEDT
jgi:hypothetical protein